jgi:hypothetical protein
MTAAPGHVIAGCFALAAFVVGLISGLAAQNPAVTVLVRALLAMVICYPLGAFVGMVCERAINRHVAEHRRSLDLGQSMGDIDDVEVGGVVVAHEILEVDGVDAINDPDVIGITEPASAA